MPVFSQRSTPGPEGRLISGEVELARQESTQVGVELRGPGLLPLNTSVPNPGGTIPRSKALRRGLWLSRKLCTQELGMP